MEKDKIKNSQIAEKSSKLDIQAIAEILTIFSRGIKTSLLYPLQNPIPCEFKKSCWDKLQNYLDTYGQLELDIHSNSFRHRQQVLYQSPNKEENIAGLMHRDGIRFVKFHAGLQKAEWEGFFDDILTVLRDDDKYEDLVNLFWQRDFVNIEYEAVDEFTLSEIESNYKISSNSDVEYSEVLNIESQDNSVSALQALDPENNSAEQSLTAEDNKFIDKIFQNIQKFSQEERDEIDAMVAADEELIIEFEAINLLFDILKAETELRRFDESLTMLNIMYDKMLAGEQFSLLVHQLKGLKDIHKRFKGESATRADKIKDCINRCGDKIRIGKITNLLNNKEGVDLDGIRMYLEELDWENLPMLIWMLGELEYFPARKMLIQAIVNKGRDRIDLVGNAVFDSRWYVVRNATLILGEIGTQRSLSHLKKPLEHFDERVRWEAVVAIEKIAQQSGYEMLLPLLHDESDRVRRKVIQIIRNNHITAALDSLKALIFNKDFNELGGEDQKEYISALALCGGEEAIDLLRKLALKRNLLFKNKYEVQNEAAVTALSLIDSPKVPDVMVMIAQKQKGSVSMLARLLLEKKYKAVNQNTEVGA